MSQQGTLVYSIEGDTVDLIAYRYFGSTTGTTESLLSNNPGLAALGPVLPAGVRIYLPTYTAPATSQQIQLWD